MDKLSRVSDEKEKQCAYISLILGYVFDMLMGVIIITCLKNNIILIIPKISVGLQFIAYLIIGFVLGMLLSDVADAENVFLTVCVSGLILIISTVVFDLLFSVAAQTFSNKGIIAFIILILSYVTFEAVMFTIYFFFDVVNRTKSAILAVVFIAMSVGFYWIAVKAGTYWCLALVVLELLSLIYLEWCFNLIKNSVHSYFNFLGTEDLLTQTCIVFLQTVSRANFMLLYLPCMCLKAVQKYFK